MDKKEIIIRLKNISRHTVHAVGEPTFILSLDDGIALGEAISMLNELEEQIKTRDESLEKAREEIKWLRGMLKEQKTRELTIDEWREWKANPKRNPICELWEHDTSPMWILNPNDVHEPALLMGKLKLFTGKPTFDQCKEVKWNDIKKDS